MCWINADDAEKDEERQRKLTDSGFLGRQVQGKLANLVVFWLTWSFRAAKCRVSWLTWLFSG
jgi:hypothetical protein